MSKSVVILFGGPSQEHEVSVRSAKNIWAALDKSKYEASLVGMAKTGELYNYTEAELSSIEAVGETPSRTSFEKMATLNCVVFSVIHGHFGEDGKLQSILEYHRIPYVGSGPEASAICMNKHVCKTMLEKAEVPVTPWRHFVKSQPRPSFDEVKSLGAPLFIKPSREGSSLGVSKIREAIDFEVSLNEAFIFDDSVIVETGIDGRELECAVLQKEGELITSPIGEIVPNADFYDFDAKYIDPNGAELIIPAKIDPTVVSKIQDYAKKAFSTLGCRQYARVDFFLGNDGKIYLNEINTAPGFTSISMYPKMIEEYGISYQDLVSHLIDTV
jgi:D-alanine-D-alanine ligase